MYRRLIGKITRGSVFIAVGGPTDPIPCWQTRRIPRDDMLRGGDSYEPALRALFYRVIPLEQRRPVCSGRQAVLPGRQVVHNRVPPFHGHSDFRRVCQVHPLVLDAVEQVSADPVRRCLQRLENRLMKEPSQVCLSRKQGRLDIVSRCIPAF